MTALAPLAAELGVVLPLSIFEKAGPEYFNSLVMVDADGALLGLYRKSHIPDGPGYEEKFYFKPGDTGFSNLANPFRPFGRRHLLGPVVSGSSASNDVAGSGDLVLPDCDRVGAGEPVARHPAALAACDGWARGFECRSGRSRKPHRGRRRPDFFTGRRLSLMKAETFVADCGRTDEGFSRGDFRSGPDRGGARRLGFLPRQAAGPVRCPVGCASALADRVAFHKGDGEEGVAVEKIFWLLRAFNHLERSRRDRPFHTIAFFPPCGRDETQAPPR